MEIKKFFKPTIIIFIILNMMTVILLVSHKISEDKETMAYMLQADVVEQVGDLEGKGSVLSTSDTVDVHISANTDLGLKTEAAIIAQVGKNVVFTVEGIAQGDTLSVRGDNNYVIDLETKNYGEYNWVPERAGVFEMVLKDRIGNERITRRINVTAKDCNDFYELTPVTYNVDANNNVSFYTSIFNMPINELGNEALPTTQFTIGESGIWTKTIKAYATSKEDIDAARLSIVEGKDFLLDRGSYTVTAALKDLYSLDNEDTKTMTYEKKVDDGHEIVIEDIELIQSKNDEGISTDRFIVHAHCKHHKDCDLVYAFFIDDTISTKSITGTMNGYTESNEITIPSIQWTYTLTVKVKHKHNSEVNINSNRLLLPNAYEAVSKKTVVKAERTYDPIQIKEIRVQPCLLKDYYEGKGLLPVQILRKEQEKGTVYVGNNNYITVNLADDEEAEKLKFSAWVIENGQTITLEPVYENEEDKVGNTFVYYPRTGGLNAYEKNKTNTIYIVVTEENNKKEIIRKASKTIEVNVK